MFATARGRRGVRRRARGSAVIVRPWRVRLPFRLQVRDAQLPQLQDGDHERENGQHAHHRELLERTHRLKRASTVVSVASSSSSGRVGFAPDDPRRMSLALAPPGAVVLCTLLVCDRAWALSNVWGAGVGAFPHAPVDSIVPNPPLCEHERARSRTTGSAARWCTTASTLLEMPHTAAPRKRCPSTQERDA